MTIRRPRRWGFAVVAVLALLLTAGDVRLRADITLAAISPTGVSAGVTLQIVGTGFAPAASSNIVIITPASGPAVTLTGRAIALVDAARDVRRLTITVPVGLAIGSAAIQVRNLTTGETTVARSIQIIEVTIPEPVAALRGATGVTVRFVGSPNVRFSAGRTKVLMGAGVTVTGIRVVSQAELVATVNVAGSAAPGVRVVTISTEAESTLTPTGFSVVATPPANRPPVASANGPYTGTAGQAVAFSSAGSSDPDGDALQYAWDFGDGETSTGPSPSHVYASAGAYTATLTVTDGRGGRTSVPAVETVELPPNRGPTASANGPYNGVVGQAVSLSSTGSSDPDGDPLQFVWSFGDGATSPDPNPSHTYATPGRYAASLIVSDGRGGSATASAAVSIDAPVTLQSLEVVPPSLRFSDLGATAALTVTGRYSDGTLRDLTSAGAGTTYASTVPSVATVDDAGVVTAVGNGSASVRVVNGGLTAGVPVTVEQGVSLRSLALLPSTVTLREIGTSTPLSLQGAFSDGSVRDLTRDGGTRYAVEPGAVVSVGPDGVATALAEGSATVTATVSGLSASSQVRVLASSSGVGFVRGEVFDDSRGLPLAEATATLLVSGGGATPGAAVAVDARGAFSLGAGSGRALVRVSREGFTSVDRVGDVPRSGVTTLLDARLTPLDPRTTAVPSVFGGEAVSTGGSAAVSIPPGSLDADATLRVTVLSNQGLQGVLPAGWSPIAAADVAPADRAFAQGATLRLPHADTLAAGVAVVVARYDATTQQWVAQAPGRVSDDRRTLSASIAGTGQFAFLVPDDAPVPPPLAIPGQPIGGGAAAAVPGGSTASGQVVPRSAPPGDDVRAQGTVILQPPMPLPSGAVLRARVTEQFDLLDSTRVVPAPFVQDLVLYARPRLGDAGTLATRLPITPSLQYSIQQLSRGTVRLDVGADDLAAVPSIIGAAGGSVADAAGTVLELSPGALSADAPVGLLPLREPQLSVPVPAGYTLLGATVIDVVGASFVVPAALSIPRPSGLVDTTPVIVARVVTDPSGGRRPASAGWAAMGGSAAATEGRNPSTSRSAVAPGSGRAEARQRPQR